MLKLQAVLLKRGRDFINLTEKFSHNCAYVHSVEGLNISRENQVSCFMNPTGSKFKSLQSNPRPKNLYV